jgi:hypothetical protein
VGAVISSLSAVTMITTETASAVNHPKITGYCVGAVMTADQQ